MNMIAVAEGGIINQSDSDFASATSDALYGILVNEKCRLTYDISHGLDLVSLQQ